MEKAYNSSIKRAQNSQVNKLSLIVKNKDPGSLGVIEGIKAIETAIKSKIKTHGLFLSLKGLEENRYERLLKAGKDLPECFYLNQRQVNKIKGTKTTQGAFLLVEPEFAAKKEVFLSDMIFILDGVQDPGNLGTIIRSLALFRSGLERNSLILINTVSLTNPKVLRSATGSIAKVKIRKEDNLLRFCEDLKWAGYRIYLADTQGEVEISTIRDIKRCAFIFGAEGKGLSEQAKNMDLQRAFIRTARDELDSLNIGVAASIFAYIISLPKMSK